MMLKNRRRTAAVALVATLVGAGAAFAYFSTAGSGDGAASVTTAAPLTIASATPTGDLYPGGTTDVALSLANPNDFPLHVDALRSTRASARTASRLTRGTRLRQPRSHLRRECRGRGLGRRRERGARARLAGAIAMGPEADDACQGATFTVYLKTRA